MSLDTGYKYTDGTPIKLGDHIKNYGVVEYGDCTIQVPCGGVIGEFDNKDIVCFHASDHPLDTIRNPEKL